MADIILSEKDFQEIRKYSLIILKELMRICDKHNIEYFVIGGTAIGMVRNGGFIPWDDDLDVGMIREDFDRFIEIAPKEMGSEYKLYSAEINKNIQGMWAQMDIKDTVYATARNLKWPQQTGIKIDICPYDYMPEDDKERHAWYKEFSFWSRLYIIANTKVPDLDLKGFKGFLVKAACHVAYIGMKIIRMTPAKLIAKCGKIARRYEGKTGWLTLIDDTNPDQWMMKKDELIPTKEGVFEGITVKIPNDNHACLTRNFGDYMVPPPEDQRVAHHMAELKYPEE